MTWAAGSKRRGGSGTGASTPSAATSTRSPPVQRAVSQRSKPMSADVRERHATGATPYRDSNDLRLGVCIDASTFRFVRDYPHPPAMVWAALTEPTQLGVWLWPCRSFEPRLGGGGGFDPGKGVVRTVTGFE